MRTITGANPALTTIGASRAASITVTSPGPSIGANADRTRAKINGASPVKIHAKIRVKISDRTRAPTMAITTNIPRFCANPPAARATSRSRAKISPGTISRAMSRVARVDRKGAGVAGPPIRAATSSSLTNSPLRRQMPVR